MNEGGLDKFNEEMHGKSEEEKAQRIYGDWRPADMMQAEEILRTKTPAPCANCNHPRSGHQAFTDYGDPSCYHTIGCTCLEYQDPTFESEPPYKLAPSDFTEDAKEARINSIAKAVIKVDWKQILDGAVVVKGPRGDRYTTCSYQHNLAITCGECMGKKFVTEDGIVLE